MATVREPHDGRGITAPTRDREDPPSSVLADLGWSREWTTLLVRALDGDLDARRIWELLAENGDPEARAVVATLGYLEATR